MECPLIKQPCRKGNCAWWIDRCYSGELNSAHCAVVALALVACQVIAYNEVGEAFITIGRPSWIE